MRVDRERMTRKQQAELIGEQLKAGLLMPVKRRLGNKKYRDRLPDFQELDEVKPSARHLEASSEPILYRSVQTAKSMTASSGKATSNHCLRL